MNVISKKFNLLVLVVVYALGIVGIVASGSSGDGDDDSVNVSFPTPTLPANAITLNDANAREIAEESILFAVLLNNISDFKTETPPPPTINEVIEKTIEYVKRRGPGTSSIAARTEDLSAYFCPNGGSAIVNSNESDDSLLGRIDFTDCDIGLGILISGALSFDGTENSTTLDYQIRIGGTLVLSNGVDPDVTFVMDFNNSGNDGTGDFSNSTNYSVDGRPGGGYLVTTIQAVTGNYFSSIYQSGQLTVDGASNTQLRITVDVGNTANVELDDGLGGGFVPVPPPIDLLFF